MAGWKTTIDSLDVDELRTVPADLSKLSNVVDNDFLKKNVYDKLVIKVNAIDSKIPSNIGLITKAEYDSEKQGLWKSIDGIDKKILNISGLQHKKYKDRKQDTWCYWSSGY